MNPVLETGKAFPGTIPSQDVSLLEFSKSGPELRLFFFAVSDVLNEVIAYQLGNHIGREEYDAQVSVYQAQYPAVDDAIRSAEVFERV